MKAAAVEKSAAKKDTVSRVVWREPGVSAEREPWESDAPSRR